MVLNLILEPRITERARVRCQVGLEIRAPRAIPSKIEQSNSSLPTISYCRTSDYDACAVRSNFIVIETARFEVGDVATPTPYSARY